MLRCSEWKGAVLLCCLAATGATGRGEAEDSGTGEAPWIRIISPAHGAVLRGPHVSVHAEVSGFEMSLERGCAIVFLNTQRRHKTCTSEIMVELADVRDGLSVVDVVLVDDRDNELTHIATASFILDPTGIAISATSPSDPRHTSSSLIDAVYSAATARPMKLLLSFSTDHMRDSLYRLASTALVPGGVDGTILYGPEHMDRHFVHKTASIFAQRKGAGLWLWKPWLINQTLHHRPEGELIIYVDAGLSFVSSATPLFELAAAAQEEIVCFGMALHSERKFTKRRVLETLGCEHDECVESGQRAATFILFRVGPKSRAFVKEWLELASDVSLISETESETHPEHDDFLAHRHDQSIFSVLTKKHGIKAHRVPTQYGLDPVEQAAFSDRYIQILQAK